MLPKEKFKHTLQAIDDKEPYPYHVELLWGRVRKAPWNEMYAQTIELFGLPGDRYIALAHSVTINFYFKIEQDQLLFKLKWSEYEL